MSYGKKQNNKGITYGVYAFQVDPTTEVKTWEEKEKQSKRDKF